MSAYIDRAYLELLGHLPVVDLDAIEADAPGCIEGTIQAMSGYADSRLRKRYVVPLVAPFPEPIRLHVAALVTASLYLRRGPQPAGEQNEAITALRQEALDFLKELADGKDGLAELPLRADLQTTEGVAVGGPLAFTSSDPYAFLDEEVASYG